MVDPDACRSSIAAKRRPYWFAAVESAGMSAWILSATLALLMATCRVTRRWLDTWPRPGLSLLAALVLPASSTLRCSICFRASRRVRTARARGVRRGSVHCPVTVGPRRCRRALTSASSARTDHRIAARPIV